MSRRLGTLRRAGLVAVAVLAWPAIARADVISDEEGVCRGKGKGDACEVRGEAGSCVESTCSFNDYSNGPPPKVGQRACFVCQVGAPAKDAAPAKEEPTPAQTDASKTDASKTDASKSEPSKLDGKPVPKTGCSIDGALGPGAAALGVLLLVLARRARRPGPR